jgi:hypothetical protein
MTKDKSKTLRALKKKLGIERARATREAKGESLTAVLEDRLEFLEDFYDLFCGLSRRTLDKEAYYDFFIQSMRNYLSPQKIVEFLGRGRLE